MEYDRSSIVGTDKNKTLNFQIGLLWEMEVGNWINYIFQFMTYYLSLVLFV